MNNGVGHPTTARIIGNEILLLDAAGHDVDTIGRHGVMVEAGARLLIRSDPEGFWLSAYSAESFEVDPGSVVLAGGVQAIVVEVDAVG